VLRPDPAVVDVDEIVAMVAEAERPIVLGGRGAMWSGAKGVLESMAQEAGALLATTLLGKGLFDGNPFALDIAGTFATDLGREPHLSRSLPRDQVRLYDPGSAVQAHNSGRVPSRHKQGSEFQR
jgi:hypothetical protein